MTEYMKWQVFFRPDGEHVKVPFRVIQYGKEGVIKLYDINANELEPSFRYQELDVEKFNKWLKQYTKFKGRRKPTDPFRIAQDFGGYLSKHPKAKFDLKMKFGLAELIADTFGDEIILIGLR